MLGHATDTDSGVGVRKLISLVSPGEKCIFVLGELSALVAGFILPLYTFFMGDMFEGFDPSKNAGPEAAAERDATTLRTLWIFLGIAGGLWIFIYIFLTCMLSVAASLQQKTRIAYIKAVFAQECAWFDQTGYTEISARMSKEISSMEQGVGQKYGMVWFSVGVGLSGLICSFVRGASLTGAYFGIAPLLLIGTALFASVY